MGFDKLMVEKIIYSKIIKIFKQNWLSLPLISKNNDNYSNIIYYNDNMDFSTSIYKDSDDFEINTNGAFILCTNIESLKILTEEILGENKIDNRIKFNLIIGEVNFKVLNNFFNENIHFYDIIDNICLYNSKKKIDIDLKFIYAKIKNNIYNKKEDVIDFIRKNNKKEIKPFNINKLLTYELYIKNAYFIKDIYFEMSQFYGDLNPETYRQYLEKYNNLENLNKIKENIYTTNYKNFYTFDKFKDLEILDCLIKEYNKFDHFGDLNKWLSREKISQSFNLFLISRCKYYLNNYAKENKLYLEINKKELYYGTKLTLSKILSYERAKGKIILVKDSLVSSEDFENAYLFSGRENTNKKKQNYSVIFTIMNMHKEGWIPNAIIEEDKKTFIFLPFSFYYLRNIIIDSKNYTADIYLETVGKVEMLEEKIKEGKELFYNGKENLIEVIEKLEEKKFLIEDDEIIKLKKENETLKNEINKINNELKKEKIDNEILNNKIKNYEKLFVNKKNYNENLKELFEDLNIRDKEIRELKEIKSRYPFDLLKGEKIMSIVIISDDENYIFSTICKNTEPFAKIEKLMYNKYPDLKESKNDFILINKTINKQKTLEENGIEDGSIISLFRK